MPNILVIGAGLSGLMATDILRHTGAEILVVDKGRSVGGRLATRRMGSGRADHGAQFFTVRSAELAAYVTIWEQAALVYPWSTGWSNGSLDTTPNDGHPRYAVRGGMNQLAKYLAEQITVSPNITIRTDARVQELRGHDGVWSARLEDGSLVEAATVITTAPVPQSLTLLQAGGATLSPRHLAALQKIRYAPCLCLLMDVSGQVNLPPPGARQTPEATVTWIADNQAKGISPDQHLLTVHAHADFSTAHYDAPDQEIVDSLVPQLASVLGDDARIQAIEVKRWRYALPTVLYPEPYLYDEQTAPIYFGGDAFGGPRVEGAALSGLAMGHALAEKMAVG